jgi:hypothetical protein
VIPTDGDDSIFGDNERLEGRVPRLVQPLDQTLDRSTTTDARHLLRQRRHQVVESYLQRIRKENN